MDANRERSMGKQGVGGTGDTSTIWLRYSTQFTSGGRTHTIEMEVPVPVGASAELRDQLIREAEADMEQLYRRVESRTRGQSQPAQAASSQAGQPGQVSRRDMQPERPVTPVPPARESQPQPLSLPDRRAAQSQPAAAPVRPGIAAELPVTPDLASSASGNMKLGEFIQIIRESWGITPKQALDLLQVKSLNNMNYRDLLRRLEPLVGQMSGGSASGQGVPAVRPERPAGSPAYAAPAASQSLRTPTPAATQRETGQGASRSVVNRPPVPAPAPAAHPMQAEPVPLAGPANIPVYPIRERGVREPAPVYGFDEEEDAENAGHDDEQADEEQNSMSSALARIKIDDLRNIHGTTVANGSRLLVLHNVLDSQISSEQFQQLIELLWRTSSDKKLKQDQVEALIYWAKEDYFEDEVQAVLAVLNDE